MPSSPDHHSCEGPGSGVGEATCAAEREDIATGCFARRLRRLRTGEWHWLSLQWVWIRRRWQHQVTTVQTPGFGDHLEFNPDDLAILISGTVLVKALDIKPERTLL